MTTEESSQLSKMNITNKVMLGILITLTGAFIIAGAQWAYSNYSPPRDNLRIQALESYKESDMIMKSALLNRIENFEKCFGEYRQDMKEDSKSFNDKIDRLTQLILKSNSK